MKASYFYLLTPTTVYFLAFMFLDDPKNLKLANPRFYSLYPHCIDYSYLWFWIFSFPFSFTSKNSDFIFETCWLIFIALHEFFKSIRFQVCNYHHPSGIFWFDFLFWKTNHLAIKVWKYATINFQIIHFHH